MAKKLMSVKVNGNSGEYYFNFYGDPDYLQEWRNDGLEIDLIENTFPMWVLDFGLVKPWCFLQDIFNFKNPFKGR